MFRLLGIFLVLFFLLLSVGCATIPRPPSIPMTDLSGSRYYPANTKKLISQALLLSKKRLNYRFGSSDPRRGGMDCSGTIHYLLQKAAHINSPRDSRSLYLWVENKGVLYHVHSNRFSSPDFNKLRPGDLLFWTGTYRTHRKPPITHVMLYLGRDKQNRPRMFGATEGTHRGRVVRGVGVFDFTLPSRRQRARFVAYGCIPSYTCSTPKALP
jgi:NlpC/P60 family